MARYATVRGTRTTVPGFHIYISIGYDQGAPSTLPEGIAVGLDGISKCRLRAGYLNGGVKVSYFLVTRSTWGGRNRSETSRSYDRERLHRERRRFISPPSMSSSDGVFSRLTSTFSGFRSEDETRSGGGMHMEFHL
jgi:hypothetical protein